LPFFNRHKEIERLKKALDRREPELIVIYGRRRCGKSTLIREVLRPGDVYFLAQQTDSSLQRARLADAISAIIPGFEKAVYPDWESLFINLRNAAKSSFTLCLDEFPWLVKSDPARPGVLQKMCDEAENRSFHFSVRFFQQMMQGLVLDSSAHLYGRAHEYEINPSRSRLDKGCPCHDPESHNEYSIWEEYPATGNYECRKSTEEAIRNIISTATGVHEEPMRLFLDERRER
jgi:hypothetical protein